LLDELRAELLSLTISGAGASPSVEGTKGALETALSSAEEEVEPFRSLRAAVATAAARPRDVDVMLDFVGRAAEVERLFAAHDRYLRVIDEALSALRGDSSTDQPPRW